MFTGIIDNLGELVATERAGGGLRAEVRPETALCDLTIGESIAINGVCLTVEPGSRGNALRFFLSEETCRKTTFGSLRAGEMLNLERALKVGAALGGHIASGHVDGVGTIRRLEQRGEGWELEVTYPAELEPMLAPKGSICVDGISLTIVESTPEFFSVAVIPHTIAATRLKLLGPGGAVNLEADPLARHVVHALRVMTRGGQGDMRDLLQRAGYIQA